MWRLPSAAPFRFPSEGGFWNLWVYALLDVNISIYLSIIRTNRESNGNYSSFHLIFHYTNVFPARYVVACARTIASTSTRRGPGSSAVVSFVFSVNGEQMEAAVVSICFSINGKANVNHCCRTCICHRAKRRRM